MNALRMNAGIKRLSASEQRIMQIAWIAHATEFLTTCLKDHSQADIDTAIEHAVNLFVTGKATPGSAIPQGVRHARQHIAWRHNIVQLFPFLSNPQPGRPI